MAAYAALGSSRNALHVLRLLWARARPPRTPPLIPACIAWPSKRSYSAAAAVLTPSDYHNLPSFRAPTSYAATSPTSGSSRSSSTVATITTLDSPTDTAGASHVRNPPNSPDLDFLEDETREQEYKVASLILQPGPFEAPAPPPWPTLFPPHHAPLSPAQNARAQARPRTYQCDPLARYVLAGDLATAEVIYHELKALHIKILHRHIYLPAAISCLDGSSSGKTKFLFWLALVPNKPATRPHPRSKAMWTPLVDKLQNLYIQDVDFMLSILDVLARKGALPDVFGPIMRHLTVLTSPNETIPRMEELMRRYWASVTSAHSITLRAEAHRKNAQWRIEEMWKSYLFALHSAGWQVAARDLLDHPPAGVSWSPNALGELQALLSPESQEPPSLSSWNRYQEDAAWAVRLAEKPEVVQHVIRAKREPIGPASLADLIEELRAGGRHTLISRLERRYIGSQTAMPWRMETWYHAKLLPASRSGDSTRTLDIFATHFKWMGLPPVPVSVTAPTTSTGSPIPQKLFPSKGVITTVLPRILDLLPPGAVQEYHASYLASSRNLSPKMRPTAATHAALLRSITHLLGPDAGVLALRRTLEAGYEPGLAAYTALLCSLAGTNRLEGMVDLLRDMEQGMGVDDVHIPAPTRETYLAIAGVLERAGHEGMAEAVRERLSQFGEQFAEQSGEHGGE